MSLLLLLFLIFSSLLKRQSAMFADALFTCLRARLSIDTAHALLHARKPQNPAPQSQGNITSLALILTLITSGILSGCGQAQSGHDPLVQHMAEEPQKTSATPRQVVTPDWGNAATLTAMGHAPIATGDVRMWDRWVETPSLPDDITDLGIRYQPNAELIAQLPIDMVIDNPFYQHARNLYGDVPAESVMFAAKGEVATWADYTEPTRTLGALIGEPKSAEDYIKKSKHAITQAGAQLQARYPKVKKFAVVQFSDANNVRMYVNNSLFKPAFDAMDKELAVLGEGNAYGFVPKRVGDLAKLDDDVCLLIIEPLSPITRAEIKDSLIWQRLGYGQSRCMGELTPVWIYGGMSSLVSLANNVSAAELQGGAAS